MSSKVHNPKLQGQKGSSLPTSPFTDNSKDYEAWTMNDTFSKAVGMVGLGRQAPGAALLFCQIVSHADTRDTWCLPARKAIVLMKTHLPELVLCTQSSQLSKCKWLPVSISDSELETRLSCNLQISWLLLLGVFYVYLSCVQWLRGTNKVVQTFLSLRSSL